MIIRRTFVALCAGALSSTSRAQAKYPSKPIRIVVPWSPGGMSDNLAREASVAMSKGLGQTVFVENKPGAGSNIGSAIVAKSAPDGYTLLLGTSSNAINMALIRATPYDLAKDFVPISLFATATTTVVVPANSSIRSIKELIAEAKRRPDSVAYASPGVGSPGHLAGELFCKSAGIRLRHVPYQGAPPAMADVLGGNVPLAFVNLDVTLPHVTSGKVRALAVTQATRSALLPDVPTVAEAGLPGYEWTSWIGLLAPSGTPQDVVDRLQAALAPLREAANLDVVRKHGAEPVYSTADRLRTQIQDDIPRFSKLVKDAGITVE